LLNFRKVVARPSVAHPVSALNSSTMGETQEDYEDMFLQAARARWKAYCKHLEAAAKAMRDHKTPPSWKGNIPEDPDFEEVCARWSRKAGQQSGA